MKSTRAVVKARKRVGSGIAIFIGGSLTFRLRYKLVEKFFNNQAGQLAIVKALWKVMDVHQLQKSQRNLAFHTDSKITLEVIANPETTTTWLSSSGTRYES
jgi:ribonuclease HI